MNRLLVGSNNPHALFLQLAQEDFSRGLVLIDDSGELARSLADRIPEDLTEHTVFFDATHKSHLPSFNVFKGVPEEQRHKVATELVAAVDAMFPAGPTTLTRERSNYLLLNCVRVLLDVPGSTFLDVLELLSDSNERDRFVSECTDVVVKNFWESEFPDWDDDAILPLRSKIGAMLTSPVVRNIIGTARTSFGFSRNIVIADLNRAQLGSDAAYLLGSLLLTRAPGRVYLPNAGLYPPAIVGALLEQDRLTLGVSSLGELSGKLRTQALAIPEKIALACSQDDAEALAPYFGQDNEKNLMAPAIGPREARGIRGPFDLTAPEPRGRLKAIQHRSWAKHTKARKDVEAAIARRFLA